MFDSNSFKRLRVELIGDGALRFADTVELRLLVRDAKEK